MKHIDCEIPCSCCNQTHYHRPLHVLAWLKRLCADEVDLKPVEDILERANRELEREMQEAYEEMLQDKRALSFP